MNWKKEKENLCCCKLDWTRRKTCNIQDEEKGTKIPASKTGRETKKTIYFLFFVCPEVGIETDACLLIVIEIRCNKNCDQI